jgi:hypothetical protein
MHTVEQKSTWHLGGVQRAGVRAVEEARTPLFVRQTFRVVLAAAAVIVSRLWSARGGLPHKCREGSPLRAERAMTAAVRASCFRLARESCS